jgi:hypothetical protein
MNTAQLTNTELNIIFASIDKDIRHRNSTGKRTTAEKRLIWFDLQFQKVVNIRLLCVSQSEMFKKWTFVINRLNEIRCKAIKSIKEGDRKNAESLLSTTADDLLIEYNKDEIIDSATAEIKEILKNLPFEVSFKLEVISK